MIYRTEHPKPQFQRDNWQNLNGLWQFEIDQEKNGEARGLCKPDATLCDRIQVPFCCESKLSGIGYTDFVNGVWYQRKVQITSEQLAGRVVLHFGAVDYYTTVYINGVLCGKHQGGYVSFHFDITDYLQEGENTITVYAEDHTPDPLIPTGKQSIERESKLCHYTRTTGIWQTVWLEFTPRAYIQSVVYHTDPQAGKVTLDALVSGNETLVASVYFGDQLVGRGQCVASDGKADLEISLSQIRLWDVGQGNLYDVILEFGQDRVKSYFGLRTIEYTDYKFLLNGRSVFQRLILDQGFYPEGIYTAPSEADLVADIDRSLAMGFNGARLHEKIFEERFLYHCDRKGYLVWGEFPDWGLDMSRPDAIERMLPEWLAAIDRDRNHPAIVGWCPLNEVWDKDGKSPLPENIAAVYQATKAADPTRPCIDASGGFHGVTDIYDLHDYEQNPEIFRSYYENFAKDLTVTTPGAFPHRQKYDQKTPFFISEYGGMSWNTENGWGYGDAPKSEAEFLGRVKKLTDVLMDCDKMFGFCYTQLTDVEQEQNGLYTYDRNPKFPPEQIYPIFARPAAIEK